MAEHIIHTMGINNCGGRCMLHAHVEDGKILRFTTDHEKRNPDMEEEKNISPGTKADAEKESNTSPETKADAEKEDGYNLLNPPLTACPKGLNYHKTYLNPETRLTSPLLRVGPRGSGLFQEISWDQALDLITEEWIRIRDTYGPGSRYVAYGWGVSGMLNPAMLGKRLLALDGGYLEDYNNYSNACLKKISEVTFGTSCSGNSMDTLLDASLIILWGHNPADTRFDTCMYYLRKARKKGIPIICIDPRYNRTAKALGAEWIPIRPGTDAALADAMACEIVRAGKEDRYFMDTYCQGFTRETMPAGYEGEMDYLSYLLGRADGLVRDARWGASVTGIPEERIRSLAYLYADSKPAALVQGYGPQRHVNGEQNARGCMMLACLTGNVGISGGWPGASMAVENLPVPALPKVENPFPGQIPVYLWTRAVKEGETITHQEGLKGINKLPVGIKMILNLGGNCLINQHGDINRTKAILKDQSLCEFIVTSDLFMTPSARYSDLVLPGISFLEMDNICGPWEAGNFIGFNNKVVEPLPGCRFEYDWLMEVAKRLGIYEDFTQGHERAEDWLRWGYDQAVGEHWPSYDEIKPGVSWPAYDEIRPGVSRPAYDEVKPGVSDKDKQKNCWPAYDKIKSEGILRVENWPGQVSFAHMVRDPKHHPFQTLSGKIEIFSTELADRKRWDIPAIPGYLPEEALMGTEFLPEEMADEKVAPPLQIVGYHTIRRCHSIHDNNREMERLDPQRIHMHEKDAGARGICEGDLVEVFNARGRMRLPAHVSEDIMPGTAAIPQGAWYREDDQGVDVRGNLNVLTSLRPSPLAHGNGQHTILAWVEKDY